jgi:hypothetical protein
VPAPPPAAAAPPVQVFHKNGTTLVSQYANPVLPSQWGSLGIDFKAAQNATAILVEVAWDDTTVDLDARAQADVKRCPWTDPMDIAACATLGSALADGSFEFGVFQNTNGTPGAGDSPSRVLVDGEWLAEVLDACANPCPWTAYAWARTPAADVTWDLAVSVFYGPVPPGYTALPAA